MKTFSKWTLSFLLLIGLERGIRTQTEGFRLEKIGRDYDPNPQWETASPMPTAEIFEQPFYFLGSGVQCYAFIGADNKTVLKVFKQYHFGPSSTTLRKMPLPRALQKWRRGVLKKREKRIQAIFTSAQIAHSHLTDQTGVFHLNLNPPTETYPIITLYDKIGIRHHIDLNHTPFLLQKKADPLFSYLKEHSEEAKEIIDSFFACVLARSYLGIANGDSRIGRNFGILDGKVVEIDIGSFVKHPTQNPLFAKRELYVETEELQNWVKTHHPELSDYVEEKLLQELHI